MTAATRIENDAYVRCPHEQCDAMWSGYGEIDWIRQSWFNGACCFHYMFGHLGVLLPTNTFFWPLHMICHNLVFFGGHSPNHSCLLTGCVFLSNDATCDRERIGNKGQKLGERMSNSWALKPFHTKTFGKPQLNRKILQNVFWEMFFMLHEIHQADGWNMKQKTTTLRLGKGPTRSLYS